MNFDMTSDDLNGHHQLLLHKDDLTCTLLSSAVWYVTEHRCCTHNHVYQYSHSVSAYRICSDERYKRSLCTTLSLSSPALKPALLIPSSGPIDHPAARPLKATQRRGTNCTCLCLFSVCFCFPPSPLETGTHLNNQIVFLDILLFMTDMLSAIAMQSCQTCYFLQALSECRGHLQLWESQIIGDISKSDFYSKKLLQCVSSDSHCSIREGYFFQQTTDCNHTVFLAVNISFNVKLFNDFF